MNPVVGATGFLGGEICRRLLAQGKPVRALVRQTADPAKLENLKQLGATTATLYGAGHNPISWISLGDVAEFAVRSIDNPAARNAPLELGGPEALSPIEGVTIYEGIGGRPFTITNVPVGALRAQKEAATDSLSKAFAALMLSYALGDPIGMDNVLAKFPVKLTSVRDYATRALAG